MFDSIKLSNISLWLFLHISVKKSNINWLIVYARTYERTHTFSYVIWCDGSRNIDKTDDQIKWDANHQVWSVKRKVILHFGSCYCYNASQNLYHNPYQPEVWYKSRMFSLDLIQICCFIIYLNFKQALH